jgi:hypothetical protein
MEQNIIDKLTSYILLLESVHSHYNVLHLCVMQHATSYGQQSSESSDYEAEPLGLN